MIIKMIINSIVILLLKSKGFWNNKYFAEEMWLLF